MADTSRKSITKFIFVNMLTFSVGRCFWTESVIVRGKAGHFKFAANEEKNERLMWVPTVNSRIVVSLIY